MNDRLQMANDRIQSDDVLSNEIPSIENMHPKAHKRA